MKKWEKELKEVYEAAASIDDRSDIDCVIYYVRDLLQQAITKAEKRMIEEMDKEMKKLQSFMVKSGKKLYEGKAVRVEMGTDYLYGNWWNKLKERLLK